MKKFIYQFFTVTALTAGLASQAVAVPTYLGSWQVDQGLWWSNTPQEYSGQQAAALLFGATTGDYNPNDYVISTNG
ncbi:hypothetical protein [Undibacterium sp. SXout20W]|uniref:hypothetical protein n=1 Tax=Undibacterium sp. SXout20W TaxID=3413051 RepID=UPI003BF1F25F